MGHFIPVKPGHFYRYIQSIANLLLKLTTQYDCHILTALHTNPGSDKARGHIGSEIMRKAETVIKVTKDGEVSKVEATYCRDIEFQEFVFGIGFDGLPELTDAPIERVQDKELEELFAELLPPPKSLQHSRLVEALQNQKGFGKSTAIRRINVAKMAGVIINDSGYYRLKPKPVMEDETLPF